MKRARFGEPQLHAGDNLFGVRGVHSAFLKRERVKDDVQRYPVGRPKQQNTVLERECAG